MNKQVSRIVIGAVVGALLLAACSDSVSNSTTTTVPNQATTTVPNETTTTETVGVTDVSIENFVFGPSDLTVSVGDTVTWRNNETTAIHTATSNDGLWDSAALQPGDTFAFTFTEAGTFTYFCTVHPSMQASITVSG